jgi:hypothetical protein
MSIKEFLDNPDKSNSEFDPNIVLLRLLQKTVENQTLISSVLKKQLIQEQLSKGLTNKELDDKVEGLYYDELKNCLIHSEKKYLELIQRLFL